MPVISIDLPRPVWEEFNAQAEATQQQVQEVILSRLLTQGETRGLYQRFCDENPDLFVTKEEEAAPRRRALSVEERRTLAEKAGRGGSLSAQLIAERREQP
ncbi:MAG: hypothetical protein HY318_07275 [Armatimonadetes bacterium]|nr:hypothetical protein [Armatimonadota bacterium]